MLLSLLSLTLLAAQDPAPAAAERRSTDTDAAREWRGWRGPGGVGVASGPAPTSWSDEENVRWKVEVPGRGFSTPVVAGDRLYLTTAVPTGKDGGGGDSGGGGGSGGRRPRGATPTEQAFTVMALDRGTGELVWREVLRVATPHEGYHGQYGSWASYSPLVRGEDLFVSFGSQGVWCLTLDGEVRWSFDPGAKLRTRNAFGEGANFVVHGDTLVHVFDHEGDSFVVALDATSGDERWRKSRDEPTTWAMPIVVEHGGETQVVTSGTNLVRSYRLSDGEVLWECGGLGLNAIPSLVRHGDLVLAMSGYRDPNLMAIRLGGEGDLTGTDRVVWSTTRGCSYTASPVLVDGMYYAVMDRGFISCFDAGTGEEHYVEERLPRGSTLKASPIAAGKYLYVATEAGDVHLVELGPELKVAATNTLADQFFIASPVVAGGELFLRSRTHLFCISEGKGGGRDV
jgi:outer membrane protein assembly factor BamB